MLPYRSLSHLLEHPLGRPPLRLDSITFEYQGITFHAYGVLHGLTGGTNRQYVELVNKTIANASGLKLGEKAFSTMYRGLDGELHDWYCVPPRDAFFLGMHTVLTPLRIARLVKIAISEKRTAADPFGKHSVARLQDIGGSAYFHQLDPFERRRVAGFPSPVDYLRHNLARRSRKSDLDGPVFPSPEWAWLTDIEPYANIACRSVHMLAYAHEWATRNGVKEVSLFVGEVHNSDIAWYAGASLPEELRKQTADIERAARELARKSGSALGAKAAYLAAVAGGMTLPVVAQLLAARWLVELVF